MNTYRARVVKNKKICRLLLTEEHMKHARFSLRFLLVPEHRLHILIQNYCQPWSTLLDDAAGHLLLGWFYGPETIDSKSRNFYEDTIETQI